MTINLEQYKTPDGTKPWGTTYRNMLTAVESAVNENASGLAAIYNVTGGGNFGTKAGSVTISPVKPTIEHAELTYPSGTTFNKDDYTDLYQNCAAGLTDWSAISSGTTADLYSIVKNDGRMIAVGTNKAIYSTASPWTSWSAASTNPGGGAKALAANGLTGANAVLVAVGDADMVCTSTGASAGDNWSTQTSPAGDSNFNWSDVKWFAGNINKFVAVAYRQDSPSSYTTCIGSSADGVTWDLEKTISGRFEAIAYNNNYGSVNEFLLVGHGGLGSTYSALKASVLNGTWTNVTIGGGSTAYQLNDVQYFDNTSARIFAVCGNSGVIGGKSLGVSDITLAPSASGSPSLNSIGIDSTELKFYAMGGLVSGFAYIYGATLATVTTAWTPDAVGSYALYDYVEDGAGKRIVVGSGGTLFGYASSSGATFTIPYPSTVALQSPLKYWVLTNNVVTLIPTAEEEDIGTGDLTKLETDWEYVKVGGQFIRSFAINSEGVIVAGGDGGMLYKSTDNGNTWVDIGTGLAITWDISAITFNAADCLVITGPGGNCAITNTAMTSFTTNRDNNKAYGSIIYDTEISEPVAITKPYSSSSISTTYDTFASTGTISAPVSSSFNTTSSPANFRTIYANGNFILPVMYATPSAGGGLIYVGSMPNSSNPVTSVTAASPITNFTINNVAYSTAWDEILLLGKSGKVYKQPGDLSTQPTAITTGVTTDDFSDAAWGAGAWAIVGRRGLLVTTNSSTCTYYPGVVCSSQIIYVPGKFRFIANALDERGYCKICKL